MCPGGSIVFFPEKRGKERGNTPLADKTREEIKEVVPTHAGMGLPPQDPPLLAPRCSEAILTLYACVVNSRAISRFLEGIYSAFYSPQSISRLTQVMEGEVHAWRERPCRGGITRDVPRMERAFPSAEEKVQGNRCTWLWGSSPTGVGRSWASVVRGRRGKRQELGDEKG